MGTYVKTTGDLVTVRPKKTSAANQGRMLLDDALIEMLDIMLPVGELKTFSTDQVDSWIAKMAEYGQEWMVPEGQLLKVADYPELFALIGYNYGWSDANPNTTYTYTFTDVNGASKSLTLYNDLDIDGNAKAVSGSPVYFRLPNYAGRFLRCVGTATYANKWSDADGNTRQLLTTYTAEMYKGKLDAQRGISGCPGSILSGWSATKPFWHVSEEWPYYIATTHDINGYKANKGYFDISTKVPSKSEGNPVHHQCRMLVRIS